MIAPEAAVPLPGERASRGASSPVVDRFGRWVAARGWVHVLLLTGLAICLYPLAWMFLTSMKTDEELAKDEMLPSIPTFRAQSPYVRDPVETVAPADVEAALFTAILPELRRLTTSVVRADAPPEVPSVEPERWVGSVASVLLNATLAQMPRQAWSESPETVTRRYRELLTKDATSSAFSSQLCRFELSQLSLRTLDGRMFKLGSSGAETWRSESSAASLAPTGDGVRLHYRFGSDSDPPIVLAYEFELPDGVEAPQIHKVLLSIRSDDTWHGLDANLEVGGTRWTSIRTTYLAQNRGQTISFQPPTFDDTTSRARTWVPLRAKGSSARGRNARMELVVSPSSTVRAIGAEIERNYLRAFDSVPFFQYVGNSLLLVGLTIAGAVFSSAFVAYAFARLAWPGRSVALILLLATMMIPSQVTMIPSFLVWRGLGWYNTLNPLWVPAWFGSAFFIFLMIQHMKTIPRELEEAACIDGLGIVQTWWYVIVPQLKPTLAAIAIMSFLGAWNEFMGPLIYLRDQSKFPLSLGLFGMRLDQGVYWSVIMAANVLMTLPSIIVFFGFQRYFIEGMTVTGMKG